MTQKTKSTSVPLLDPTRFDEEFAAQIEEAFRRVFRSGRYILGPEVTALEEECAAYCTSRFALGVSSGSDALIIALMALGIGPGDEVICPSYTFFATGGAVWRVGAKPVFVDSDPLTYNLDPADVERKITDRTKAIMPVHLFGQCAPMDRILSIAASHGVSVIEDAAQAIGAEHEGKRAGSMGAIGCFSFFPTKNLGAFGDAGLVTTNDPALAETLEILRVHGSKPKYYHRFVGGNFRIDALQAALLRVKLPRLDRATEKRQENARLYQELFLATGLAAPGDDPDSSLPISLPVVTESRHIFNQYTLRIRDGRRDELRAHLNERGIGNEVYYPVPLHLQECFRSLGHVEGDLPVAEAAARETLAIPIFPELEEEEIQTVVSTIASFWKR